MRSRTFEEAANQLNHSPAEEQGLQRARRTIRASELHIVTINSSNEANSLLKRSDGMFDGRSRRGRELNEQLSASRNELAEAESAFREIAAALADRRKLWSGRLAQRHGSRVGAMVWCLMAASLYLAHYKPEYSIAIATLAASVTIFVAQAIKQSSLLRSLDA